MLINISLIILLTLATGFDLKYRRIPNWLIVSGLIIAMGYHIYAGGYQGGFFVLKGLLTGAALLILPFLMQGIGAGDVKLLAVIGAFKGSLFVFNSFIWMALWGGVIITVLLLHQRRFTQTIFRIRKALPLASLGIIEFGETLDKEELSIYYPYGLAIGLGAISCFFKGWC